jgi:arylformamidase
MENFDKAFNLRKRHPSGVLHMLANEIQSRIARRVYRASLDVSYGASAGEKLDIFPATNPNAPVFVFIHGGYFRALDKSQYSYLAHTFVDAGITLVVVNYDLAPKVSVSEIVNQNIKAFAWVHDNIHHWRGNNKHIVIGGHSVGSFLTAKILAHEWPKDVRKSIKGAVLLSGLYDLSQMQQSFLNKVLSLSDEEVSTLSPLFDDRVFDSIPHIIMAVGREETDEFVRQTKVYSDKLVGENCRLDCMILEGENHYTVSRLLSHSANVLMEKILKLFV